MGKVVRSGFVAACEEFLEKHGRWPIAVKEYETFDGKIVYL
jgi:hypothetical protein